MTERVDFYVLAGADPRLRLRVGCRLAEKAYLRNLKVLIALESEDEARALDELLWTFHDRAFVPHHCCGEGACGEPELPVHLRASLEPAEAAEAAEAAVGEVGVMGAAEGIGAAGDVEAAGAAGPMGADLLINLADRPPAQMLRFARIAEVIDSDPERRRLGRERFKAYRELKIPLETHQLGDAADAAAEQ